MGTILLPAGRCAIAASFLLGGGVVRRLCRTCYARCPNCGRFFNDGNLIGN